MDSYRTLFREGSAEFIEKKSRFIGYASPTETEEQALAFLEKVRAMHREASHHCYAYIIGQHGERTRFSDDGEPSGTAGKPILGILQGRELCNCICVVVRYFGGTLLGTGGLVRAYSQSARIGTEAAGISRMFLTAHILFDAPYSLHDIIERQVRLSGYQVQEISFATSVTYDLYIRKEDLSPFLSFLTQVSSGQIEPLVAEEIYMPWQTDT